MTRYTGCKAFGEFLKAFTGWINFYKSYNGSPKKSMSWSTRREKHKLLERARWMSVYFMAAKVAQFTIKIYMVLAQGGNMTYIQIISPGITAFFIVYNVINSSLYTEFITKFKLFLLSALSFFALILIFFEREDKRHQHIKDAGFSATRWDFKKADADFSRSMKLFRVSAVVTLGVILCTIAICYFGCCGKGDNHPLEKLCCKC